MDEFPPRDPLEKPPPPPRALANDRVGRPISEAMMQAAISFELFCIDVLSQEGGTF
jgi:hypothetical protein